MEEEWEAVKLKKAEVLFSPTEEQEKVAEEYKAAKQKFKEAHDALKQIQAENEDPLEAAKQKLLAAEQDLIKKENIKAAMPFGQNGGKDYDQAVKDEPEQVQRDAHFQAAKEFQAAKDKLGNVKPSPKSKGPLTKTEAKEETRRRP